MIEADGGLHQRVEATLAAPQAGIAVGAQRHADDAGACLGQRGRAEAQFAAPAGAITLHEDMRVADQMMPVGAS